MDARDDQALQNKGYDAFEARKSKVLEIMSARGNYPIPAPVAKQGLRAFESPVAAAFTFLSALDPEGPWTFVWQDFKGGWHVRAGEPANWSAEYFANYAAGIYENAYFNVNRAYDWLKGRAKEDDIGALRMFHVELDAYDKHGPAVNWSDPAVIAERKQACSQAVNEVHRRYKVCPAFVVWSGGGVHLYYRLKEVILLPDMRFCPRIGSKEFEQQPLDLQERQKTGRWQRAWYNGYVKAVNGALAEAFKTVAGELQLRLKVDGVHDVTRILRVPGSMSIPDAEKQAVGRVPAPVELMYQAKPGLAGYEGYSPEELASLLTAHGVDLAAVQLQSAEKAVAAPARGGNIPAFDGEADGTLASLKVQRVHHVLSHIPCGKRIPYQLGGKTHYSDDRETWVCVLQGVKDELGEAGRPVMKTWEGGWPRPQLQDQWDTFNKKGVGFGTVVEIARQFGYDTQKDLWLAKIRELENDGLADEAFAGVQGAEELNGRPVKYEWIGIHRVPVEGGQQPAVEQQPVPEALPEPLLPVEPFDFDLLPSPLRPWARDLHERMGCPGDYIGVPIMVGLGAVIGRKIVIRPKEHDPDWVEAANNFGMLIGRPGILKTPAVAAALKPLNRLEAAAREAHKEDMAAFEALQKVSKARAKVWEKNVEKAAGEDLNKPIEELAHILRKEAQVVNGEPNCKRYTTNDANPASLGKLLIQNPNGILVHRDELVSLFESFHREDMDGMRGLFLSGWSGTGSHTLDRINRGLDLHIPSLCISMLGTTQPGKIASYIREAVEEGQGDDGLLQRFQLAVWPDTPARWEDVDRPGDPQLRKDAFEVFEKLDQLSWVECGALDTYDGKPAGLPYLRFDPPAQKLFREWRHGLEITIRSGELGPALESHLAKYRKLVPSLALTCHLAEGHRGLVGVEALDRAIRWAKYLVSHARRIYGSGPTATVAAAKAILARVKAGKLSAEFSARDIQRNDWAQRGKSETIKDALELLYDRGWILARKPITGTAGRPKTYYRLNPRAKQLL